MHDGAVRQCHLVVEDAVFEYIELFCADTQPAELRALRELALVWMERMAEFRPHLTGAVWLGTERPSREDRAAAAASPAGIQRRWRSIPRRW